MLRIGCHLSSSKGYLAMGKQARAIGANTFQFFTRNPRGGNVKALDMADIENYLAFAKEEGIEKILAHAPYTLNAGSEEERLQTFTRETMLEDLRRLEHIPGAMYNFHPGSHGGRGPQEGARSVARMLDQVLKQSQNTMVLLETMSGKGNEIGRTFEELRQIIDAVELKEKLGVCLDTCHVFDGGYDVAGRLEEVLEEFDDIVGLWRLKAIHLNDSMNALGSHKDRHSKIGEGGIGLEAFRRIVNHPSLKDLPFYLETPNDLDGYAREIALLREMAADNSHFVEK